MVRVKVCGVTSVADALLCAEAGADAIGLNFWPKSARRCDERAAAEIVRALREAHPQVLVCGVFVDAPREELARLRDSVGLGCLQLHGDEPPELLAPFLPHAYKAHRVRGREVLDELRRFPGDYALLDAYVPGLPGGTGATFDWAIAREAASLKRLALAGGLTADNVAEAVRAVRPFCVDTASGVELRPGVKSPELVRRFIAEAHGA